MLEQILTNLVSNAVKYSPEDRPIVVTARESGDRVEVSVEDRGIGMSEQDREALFQKFFRADHPAVHAAGGTGLGLYIARSLVEALGGTITVESAPGEGSTFTFTISAVAGSQDTRKETA
ncbi:MAG: sensor histidine kinase [Actinomycetota bacterium]